MNWFILTILMPFMGAMGLISPTSSYKSQKCAYHKAYKMTGAHCVELNLQSVPAILRTNIEILDLTRNRIRELRNETFTRYTSLKYLYISDNMIQVIDSAAFEPLTYLETLDLTLNSITTVPEHILNMPLLRKLYIGENRLTHFNHDLQSMEKPFKAPLEYLGMFKCELTEVPDLGLMPALENLNLSSNNFNSLTPKNLAQFCSLKVFDITNSFTFSEDKCKNKLLIDWLVMKSIEIVPELSSIMDTNDLKKCDNMEFDPNDVNDFDECKKHIRIKEKERSTKQTWTIVGGCLGGFFILGIIFLLCMHRKNVKSNRSQKTPKELDGLMNES